MGSISSVEERREYIVKFTEKQRQGKLKTSDCDKMMKTLFNAYTEEDKEKLFANEAIEYIEDVLQYVLVVF